MRVFITGGAGFIGANLAQYHLGKGHHVTVVDNLCRQGARKNISWLRGLRSVGRMEFVELDVRDAAKLKGALSKNTDRIYHLAGQVAVTSSVTDPRHDFETNAAGTFNILEALRLKVPHATFIYASTNKVYGKMSHVAVRRAKTRYVYRDLPYGISEGQPVDFHSPYGCSKGCGDSYAVDYARIYGLRTLVFRQSCIYGFRQFGVEDQGWLAHFCIAAIKRQKINIYGDGRQVRDVLWIDDLIAAYEAGASAVERCRGEVFNVGGGPANTISIWGELRPVLERLAGRKIQVVCHDWRPGDQLCYISDIRKAGAILKWRPKVCPKDGVDRLYRWIESHPDLFR